MAEQDPIVDVTPEVVGEVPDQEELERRAREEREAQERQWSGIALHLSELAVGEAREGLRRKDGDSTELQAKLEQGRLTRNTLRRDVKKHRAGLPEPISWAAGRR